MGYACDGHHRTVAVEHGFVDVVETNAGDVLHIDEAELPLLDDLAERPVVHPFADQELVEEFGLGGADQFAVDVVEVQVAARDAGELVHRIEQFGRIEFIVAQGVFAGLGQ